MKKVGEHEIAKGNSSVITTIHLLTTLITSWVTVMVQPLACLYLILISFALFLSAYFPIPPDIEVGKYEYLSLNINLKPLLAPEQLGLACSH